MLAPYVMLSARDAKLNDYYYGVKAAADRPAYRPGAGLNGSIGLNARYDLTDTWHFFAGVSATLWASGVRRSPIVEDRAQLAAYGGLAYEFVPTPAKDDRVPLTFKVLPGRYSPCNLLPIMELRCRSIDTVDRTSVDSFEIGRPFIESPHGWPVMIAWYAGLLRHEERGLQPDSWQLNGYLKAFYWDSPGAGACARASASAGASPTRNACLSWRRGTRRRAIATPRSCCSTPTRPSTSAWAISSGRRNCARLI